MNFGGNKVEKVKIYVDDHLHSGIDIKQTADFFNVSYFRFLHHSKNTPANHSAAIYGEYGGPDHYIIITLPLYFWALPYWFFWQSGRQYGRCRIRATLTAFFASPLVNLGMLLFYIL
jgi:hypothetical protein